MTPEDWGNCCDCTCTCTCTVPIPVPVLYLYCTCTYIYIYTYTWFNSTFVLAYWKVQNCYLKEENMYTLSYSVWDTLVRAQKTRKLVKTRTGRFLLGRGITLVVELQTMYVLVWLKDCLNFALFHIICLKLRLKVRDKLIWQRKCQGSWMLVECIAIGGFKPDLYCKSRANNPHDWFNMWVWPGKIVLAKLWTEKMELRSSMLSRNTRI